MNGPSLKLASTFYFIRRKTVPVEFQLNGSMGKMAHERLAIYGSGNFNRPTTLLFYMLSANLVRSQKNCVTSHLNENINPNAVIVWPTF